MNKRQKNIVTWIIVWAGLLIVVLYSPIGSPDLYSPQNNYAYIQSVPVKSGSIINSPKGTSSSDDTDNGSYIPDVITQSGSNNTTGNYQPVNSLSQGSSYSSQPTSYQNTNPSSTGTSGGTGVSIIAGGGTRSSNGSSGIAMTNGIATLTSTDLTTSNTITKQSAPSSTQTTAGGTDPGGDPTGDPIPVGDGWGVLLLLGGIYFLFKGKIFSSKIDCTSYQD